MSLQRRKRPFLLLEVLIAFFIVALCAIPLMAPQIFMVRSELSQAREVELDRAVNILFADLLEKFYEQGVNWETVGTKDLPKPALPLNTEVFDRLGYGPNYLQRLGFEGDYTVRVKLSKVKKDLSKTEGPNGELLYHMLEIKYSFKPLRWISLDLAKDDTLTYVYDLFAQRQPPAEGTDENKTTP